MPADMHNMLRAAAAPAWQTGSHLQILGNRKKRPQDDMPLLQYPVTGQRPTAYTKAHVQTHRLGTSSTWQAHSTQQPESATKKTHQTQADDRRQLTAVPNTANLEYPSQTQHGRQLRGKNRAAVRLCVHVCEVVESGVLETPQRGASLGGQQPQHTLM